MLQLHHICKTYTTGTFTQVALDDVSVSFRDNEFVAILGPSGSGKTTLLNIVGGLDHYDSGDLVIDGISTEQYKDRDWDAYRNNRIGFVFQSYNLIPHQTVLSNVELALTLSGVSRAERRERALEALGRVGLAEHVNKKPSQLSGGQMQRVAIARALINDPEILLADEPTGALDSKTSVQIMDLLTEIANDRLVIMVTHNPELAEQYATRIVNLADGVIRSDSDPYRPTAEDMRESEKPARRTRMSFLTALALSFKNLMTKKGRTLMTAFAGSIGIIGIAAILALANGVNNYIKSVEEDTLSEYPLQIQSTGLDMTSMMLGAAAGGNAGGDGSQEAGEDQVRVSKMLTNMLSSIGSNDLAALKQYFDSGESDIDQYTNAIEYSYNATPQIYSSNTENVRQVNPDKSFTSLGLGSTSSSNSLMSMSMSTDMFSEMPSDPDLYQNQYDVKAGRWPEAENEIVLVLTKNGSISDLMQYTLGLRDASELDRMVEQFAAEEDVETPDDIHPYSYDDILSVTFKLVNAADFYQYDEEFGVWKDKSDDKDFVRSLVEDGEDLHVVGVVQPREDASATMLSAGLYYPSSLTRHVIDEAAASQIVKDQLAKPDINVFTGKPFGEEEDDESAFNMDSLFTIDGDAIQAAFTIDESKLAVDMSSALNLQGSLQNMPEAPEPNMDEIAGSLDIDIPEDKVADLMGGIMQQYMAYLQDYATTTPPKIPELDADGNPTGNIIDNPDYHPLSASDFMQQPDIKAQIYASIQAMVDTDDLEAQIATALQGYVQTTMTTYMSAMAAELQNQVTAALQQSMNQMANNMASAMSIDPDKFEDAFQMNMDEKELGRAHDVAHGHRRGVLRQQPQEAGLCRSCEAFRHRHLPHRLREQRAHHRDPGRLQRPHGGRRRRGQGHHVHRPGGHAHVVGHRHREHDQLRAGGVRGHLAGGVVHHDRRHHLHIGARTQEGDRHPALHRRQQGRHQPRVQRRDHHRGLHGRRHRHRGDRAGLHPRQRHHLFAVRRGERGRPPLAGRPRPHRHQRVPHVPGRPHPLERRQPQGPRGSAAKRVEPCTRTMPQAPPRPPTPPAPAARMRPAAPSARAQSGAPHCWWQTTNRTSSTCCANTSKGPASTCWPPPAANRRWQRRRTTPTWCFWT